uniref:Uncharacterized protein n=1 Tax=Oryza punctata TaxID=4537 RepID=A0A0E0LRY5_ORYPU
MDGTGYLRELLSYLRRRPEQPVVADVVGQDKRGLQCYKQLVDAEPSYSLSIEIPEDILCDIVSHLTLREVARASVLSRSWRHAWRCFPYLTFSHSILPMEDMDNHIRAMCQRENNYTVKEQSERFIHTVNKILQYHSGFGVKTLKIEFDLHREHQAHIDQWVRFAVDSKARDVILDLRPLSPSTTEDPYIFPCYLFTDKQQPCIEVLRLNFCSFKPPLDFPSFNNLKTLDLRSVDIIEADVDSLVSNCACLEHLRLEKCDELINLVASHPLHCLKSLVVRDCRSLERIELDTIDLTYFEFNGSMIDIKLGASPRVVDAWIGIHSPVIVLRLLSELADMLPHLQKLCLHLSSTENEMLSMSANHNMFMYLRDLDLRILHWKNLHMRDLLLLGHILDLAPVMQKFNLNLHEKQPDDVLSPLIKQLHTSLHSELKEVVITGFSGEYQYISLAAHFLFNATSLQTMEITPRYKPTQRGENLLIHRDVHYRTIYISAYAQSALRSFAPPHVKLLVR